MKSAIFELILFFFLFALSSCSSTRKLKEGEYLLVKNEVTANRKEIPAKNEIIYLIKPAANKKFLGLFPWKAGIYQAMMPKNPENDGKFKQWVRRNLGEEPIIVDSSSIEYSKEQIQQYLYNKGYFISKVDSRIDYKKHKAKVHYEITAGQAYRLNEIQYRISDTNIRNIVFSNVNHSLIKKGMAYDVSLFNKERNRIAELMTDRGYYQFRPENISYRIDSNLGSFRFNMIMVIGNNPDSVILPYFKKYYIKNVNINVSVPENNDENYNCITYYKTTKKKDSLKYVVCCTDEAYYKPKAIVYPLELQEGSLYSSSISKRSYKRYNDMQNFRFIKISFKESEDNSTRPSPDSGYLDCQVQLSRWERNKLNLEILGKNIGDDYGVGLNFSLRNRNTFHRGEIFFANFLFSTELQKTLTETESKKEIPIWRYRNFEIGGEIGLQIPKILFPFIYEILPKKYLAKTYISTGNYFQQRDHYSRFITNASLKYEWTPSNFVSRNLSLIDINIVKIYKDSIFNVNLKTYSKRIQEKYTDHFLIGTNYKFIYNDLKGETKRRNYFTLKLNLNAYGNLIYGIFSLTNAKKNEFGQYTIDGIPFTGFVSGEADFTYNLMIWNRSSLVFHGNAGIGVPTSNASTLPFERSFFLGGANSMRAWNLKSLGPGSYRGSLSSFESTGDLKVECNFELRTPIYKKFFSAVFLDVGNIWNLKFNKELKGGEFNINRFYKEFAADGGIGLRLDISFLVLRLDAAIPIYKPYETPKNKWIDSKASLKDIRFCFGIGYPF